MITKKFKLLTIAFVLSAISVPSFSQAVFSTVTPSGTAEDFNIVGGKYSGATGGNASINVSPASSMYGAGGSITLRAGLSQNSSYTNSIYLYLPSANSKIQLGPKITIDYNGVLKGATLIGAGSTTNSINFASNNFGIGAAADATTKLTVGGSQIWNIATSCNLQLNNWTLAGPNTVAFNAYAGAGAHAPMAFAAEKFYFHAGNVGIGTSTPGAQLSLGSSLANVKLALYDDGNSGNFYGFGVQDKQFRVQMWSGARFSLYSGPTNEVFNVSSSGRISSNGHTVIGEGDPALSEWSTHPFTLVGTATEPVTLLGGVSTIKNVSYLQSIKTGRYATTLALNPLTGLVAIGNITDYTKYSGFALAVNGGVAVNGKINATEVQVCGTVPCADYVFDPHYKLRSLPEVEQFIKENSHLPEVPSAKEFKSNGYNIGEMDNLLLQKVEELTLYMIEQNKIIKAQGEKIQELENKLQQQ